MRKRNRDNFMFLAAFVLGAASLGAGLIAYGLKPFESSRAAVETPQVDHPLPVEKENQFVAIESAEFSSWNLDGVYIVKADVTNETDQAIAELNLRLDLRDPGRTVPEFTVSETLDVPGGIEPGETRPVRARFVIDPARLVRIIESEQYRPFVTVRAGGLDATRPALIVGE